MIKPLLFLTLAATITLSSAVSAQSMATENATPFKTIAPAHSYSSAEQVQVASCGPDSILYPYLKELVFASPNDSFFVDAMVGNVRTASQAYLISENIDVLGVQFWGGAYSTSPSPQTLLVKAYLYSIDAQNMPVAILDSALVTVTNTYDFYEAMFSIPHALNQNFAVGVRSQLNDTLAVITNNAGNVWTPNYGEGLAWRRFGSGVWNSSASFFGQDLEYMIFPIIQYNVSAGISSTSDTACMNQPVVFGNSSSTIFNNRFVNLYAFDEYWGLAAADSSFTWNYGDFPTWSSSMNGMHTYTTSGTYSVQLAGEIIGYYTSCTDTATMMLEVMPDVIANFTYDNTAEPTIAFTDASAGAATYMWDFGDASTSTAASPSHTYANTGTYTVTLITNGYCGADTTSQTIVITTTGIETQTVQTAAYYDVNSGQLQLTLPAADALIEVYGVSGNMVYSENAVNITSKAISLNLAEGAYFVRVQTASGVHIVKFAVAR